MPVTKLTEDAIEILEQYSWPGNIRQLKNVAEQISVIEHERTINAEILVKYLPQKSNYNSLPTLYKGDEKPSDMSDREILYKVLFDMRKDINELRQIVFGLIQGTQVNANHFAENDIEHSKFETILPSGDNGTITIRKSNQTETEFNEQEEVVENLSLQDTEKELIKKALEKYRGKRKEASNELGISERTLYRKIKEYNLN
jgi:DNA-binding NtrC family response regulator